MKISIFIALTIFSIATISCNRKDENNYKITIEASELNRPLSIVNFKMPKNIPKAEYSLKSEDDREFPIQVLENGMACVVLSAVIAETSQTFSIVKSNSPKQADLQLKKDDTSISFLQGDSLLFTYHTQGSLPNPDIDSVFLRGGYIHPVITPAGKVVTDDYAWNHLHHHGLWTAWTKTEFEGRKPDFWNMGAKKGKVDFVELDTTWAGSAVAGFKAQHKYTDLLAEEPKVALHEQWEVQVYNTQYTQPNVRIIDINMVQRCAIASPLILPTYHYGGMGFRGHASWDGVENAFFLTSEGKGRSDGNETMAKWCHVGGYVDGDLAGITIMSHPSNFRHPQPVRIHPTEPFFCYSPSQAGDWSIEPGEVYEAKYRFVIYDGEADVELLNALWQDYAEPLSITIE